MADETGDSGAPGAGHQSLLQKFKDEPKWVKISALAGVAVLVVTILLYLRNQQSSAAPATDTGSAAGTANGMGASTDIPGEGDLYPSLGTPTGLFPTSNPGVTSTPTSTPTPTPSKPTGILPSPNTVGTPAGVKLPAKKKTSPKVKLGVNKIQLSKPQLTALEKKLQIQNDKAALPGIIRQFR